MTTDSTSPVLIKSIDDPSPITLQRIAGAEWSKVAQNGGASEASLQAFLSRCPSALPFAHFSSVFGPAVCIGREVPSAAGPIDLLYMSLQGRMTIVETKLHKNPEAKREVVAQVLDYAEAVSGWSYEDLDLRAKAWHESQQKDAPWPGLAKFILGQSGGHGSPDAAGGPADVEPAYLGQDAEEPLRDAIEKNLRRGEVLGLIVGDQIRRRTADLVKYAREKAGLSLELGVVELAFYRNASDMTQPLLVIPTVVQKTAIIERFVVTVQDLNGHPVQAKMRRSVDDASAIAAGRKPRLASEDQFLEVARERTSPAGLQAVRAVSEAFNEIADSSGGLYGVDYASTMLILYWRQTEDQTRRILSLTVDGKFQVRPVYLKYAKAHAARAKLMETAQRHLSVDPESGGSIDISNGQSAKAIAAAQDIMRELQPLLQAATEVA